MRRSDLLSAALAALCACAAETPAGPRPTAVEPPTGYATSGADVVIHGSDFHVRAEAQLGSAPRVDASFRAWLGDVELEDVVRVDAETLRAHVPAGLGPGTYDLAVQGPRGTGGLPAAYTAVRYPAALAATAAVSRTRLTVGEEVELALAVTNSGEADADVTPSAENVGTASASALAAPSGRIIPGGATETFTWRYAAESPGSLVLRARVAGIDAANRMRSIEVSADAPPVQVDAPPKLVARASASATAVDEGQPFTVALELENHGDADAVVTPALLASGTGLVVVEAAPVAQVVPGRGTSRLAWSLAGLSAGTASLQLSAAGVDQNSGATIPETHATLEVRVDRPAALTVSAAAPTQVSAGQPVDVTVTIRNTGDAAAAVTAAVDAAGPVQLTTAPAPPGTIDGGAVQTLRWTFATTAAGSAAFHVRVTGTDANSGAALSGAADASTTVQRPAALGGTASASPAVLNRGGTVTLVLTVSNTGEANAVGVVPAAPTLAGTASVGTPTGPTPASATVAPGSPVTFTWEYPATSAGTATFTAQATGRDQNSNATVSAPPAQTAPFTVVEPGALSSVSFVAPTAIPPSRFTVTWTVKNTGAATVRDVIPQLTISGTGTASIVAALPAAVTLDGGASAVFTWTVDATGTGRLDLAAQAAGVDVNDGMARSTFATATTVVGDVVEIARDPFQDGTWFANVTGYRGEIWLGPNRDGTRLARLNPDANVLQVVPFKIHRDENPTGRDHARNTAYAADRTYASLGFTGCTPDQPYNACGPDDEDGRGLLTSVVVNGEEWLVAGSARSAGELTYVYLTKDAAPSLAFSYVDLDPILGSSAKDLGAAWAFGNRLYLGFSDLPFGVVLQTMPGVPGLDVADPSTAGPATNLHLDEAFKITGGTFTSLSTVDTFVDFNDRLYAFDNVGCIVSKTATPLASSDFASCSPGNSTAYASSSSIAPTRQYDVEPREKAWPQAAVRGPYLFAIRNSTSGAQLWTCDPTLSGNMTAGSACESGDWTWIGFGAEGSDAPPRATLLVATPSYLYLGLEYPSGGVRLYRTSSTLPPRKGDFVGQGGCTLDAAGCPGLGGNGLGMNATQFLDAKAICVGDETSLYFTTRANSTGAFRLFRAGG